jgi:hypothetical protein
MESPLITHEQLKSIDNIEDVAYERLFENYLRYNLKGAKKLIDIESTDQETIANKIAPAIPGMVYTFINLNDKNLDQLRNIKTGKILEFHDFTPIVFCTSYNPVFKMIKGLNLNMLPNSERLKFFEAFYQYYKSFFERIEEKTEYQKEALNKKYILASMVGQNPMLIHKFNSMYSAKFNFAYRSYKLTNIHNYRMIEYEEWPLICFLNANTSFKNTNLQKIFKTYYENRDKKW